MKRILPAYGDDIGVVEVDKCLFMDIVCRSHFFFTDYISDHSDMYFNHTLVMDPRYF